MATTQNRATTKKKPSFVVKETHKSAKIKKRWRFPRGRHSGVRQFHKGKPALPTPGYGSAAAVRGLHPSGVRPIVVRHEADLAAINPQRDGIILASTLGNRKRIQLLKVIHEKKLPLIGKDAVSRTEAITSAFDARRKAKALRSTEKSKKAEEKKKKAAEKDKDETKDEASVDEVVQKEEERREAEKVITKKQ